MANPDSVSQYYLDSFGQARIAIAATQTVNAAGNAVIALPFVSGGLTKGLATANSGSVIVRRISVVNPSGSLAGANVSITTSNDGNISNVVVANTVLSSITGVNTFQDLPITGGNVCISGYTTQALYVNVNNVSANSNTVDFRIYGDVVSF
jgi:hypothetical protein